MAVNKDKAEVKKNKKKVAKYKPPAAFVFWKLMSKIVKINIKK